MEPTGCGCPPTGAPGRVHHVFVNVKDLARSRPFYEWLMPRLGYATHWSYDGSSGWLSPGGSFWLKAADPRFADDDFHKDRVGLCEIAFAAASRDEVDALALALADRGATVAGVNDNPARTCIGVHQRLNVNTNGCAFPAGY